MFENIQEIINELHRMKKEYNAPQGCCVRTQERNGYRSKCLSIAIKALSEVQTLAKAKADGRLVELPCKIGDEVWFLEKQLDIANGTCSTVISEYIVTEIRGNKYNPLWYMASSERCTHRDFHPTALGKTVFLTREEAEKALGGGE